MHYRQLSEADRYQIDAGIAFGLKLNQIAQRIERHRSTIFRELRRGGHTSREGYCALYALQLRRQRRKKCRPRFKISGELKNWIDGRLRQQWSPEQIVGRARLENRTMVGVETIYRYVYRDKLTGGDLWKNLRHTRYKRKRRFVAHRWPGTVPRTSIADRPEAINARLRDGDFERDLIVGKERKGYLLTLVDRKTKLVKIAKLSRPSAVLVHDATIRSLRGLTVRSLTNDNGREFLGYRSTSRALKVPIYFTRPYASWERGTVENTNKLIRQYFPKNLNLEAISDEKIQMVEMVLNHRPRKKLAYRTPAEVANDPLSSIPNVAL